MKSIFYLLIILQVVESAVTVGNQLARAYTKYVSQPINATAAGQMGWKPITQFCDPLMGIGYASGGKISSSHPVTLFFTESGQFSGLAVDIFGSVEKNLLDKKYFTQVASKQYQIKIGFRNVTEHGLSLCEKNARFPDVLGDRLVVNPGTLGQSLPLTENEAISQGYHRGSCFDGMGFHYFLDLSTPDTSMSWKSANLMPVVMMYNDEGLINAIFFASSTVQQSLFSSNEWEPVPLPTLAMCQNTCDSDCTFAGTSVWSTMHFYFKDYKSLKCSKDLKCTLSGIGCCPK